MEPIKIPEHQCIREYVKENLLTALEKATQLGDAQRVTMLSSYILRIFSEPEDSTKNNPKSFFGEKSRERVLRMLIWFALGFLAASLVMRVFL